MSSLSAAMSRRVAAISSCSSPMPSMRPDFVTKPAALARRNISSERSYFACGRTFLWRRGTVSTLWLRMSGFASRTVSRSCQRPLKSGMSTSMAVFGIFRAHGTDGRGPDGGAAVGQFIARDGSDDGVLQAHEPDRLGHAARLVVIELGRAAGLHRAKAAAPRADVAENHDRGRLARPTFAEVRALGALANGVELVLVDDPGRFQVDRAAGDFGAEPVRFARIERERFPGTRREGSH